MAHRVETLAEGVELHLGDCRDVLPTLGRFDALVTDPPYGIYKHGGTWGKKADLHWDRIAPQQAVDTAISMADMAIVWGGNYFVLPPSRGWLSWFKPDRVPSAADFELAWCSFDQNARQISQSIAATNAERLGHPTQKPLAVMMWCLGFIPHAKTIIDPFMGSGTTGVAAVKLGRTFTGIEIDPGHFETACKRIEQALRQPDFFVEQPAPKPEQLSILDGVA